MNRVQVMEKLQPLLNVQVRSVTNPEFSRVSATEDTLILRPSRGYSYPVTKEGVESLLKFTGVPESLGKHLRLPTLEKVFTETIQSKSPYQVITKDGTVVDIIPGTDRLPIPPERALEVIEHTIPEVDFHRVLELPHYTTAIELVGVEERPVRQGDLVRAGAEVIFSPLGTVAPRVRAFILRLACLNGATTTEDFGNFSYGAGDGGSVWTFLRNSVRKAYGSISPIVERWQAMAEENVAPEQRAEVLEALIRQARLPKLAADAVRALALREPPESAYAAMNFITYASSHLLTDGREVLRAREAAATFASETSHRRVCPVCHRR